LVLTRFLHVSRIHLTRKRSRSLKAWILCSLEGGMGERSVELFGIMALVAAIGWGSGYFW
jgi:hypothetical protein